MIAASLPIILAIWVLSVGLVINAWHIRFVYKRHAALQRRVFELEMERDFPDWPSGAHPPERQDGLGGPD